MLGWRLQRKPWMAQISASGGISRVGWDKAIARYVRCMPGGSDEGGDVAARTFPHPDMVTGRILFYFILFSKFCFTCLARGRTARTVVVICGSCRGQLWNFLGENPPTRPAVSDPDLGSPERIGRCSFFPASVRYKGSSLLLRPVDSHPRPVHAIGLPPPRNGTRLSN